jgi:L-lactate dehydrogenase complex protein LldG
MSRETIFKAVRAALGRRGDEPGRRGQVRARLERSPDGVIPARALLPKHELVTQFVAALEGQGTAVREVATLDALPQAIEELLTDGGLPRRLRHGSDELLCNLPWDTTTIERDQGAATPNDQVSLSRALTAAAETGTLFLASGPENPSTLNFLPDTQIVVLCAEDLVGSYERAWDKLRVNRNILPRTVNMISGPSCTADIEQTLIHGAHGPIRFAVLIAWGNAG